MTVEYEWDHETCDKYGDIEDHDFSDDLKCSWFDIEELKKPGNNLVLVRNDYEADGDLKDRVWAYCRVVDDKLVLADCWNNGAGDMPNWKVPKKFHQELARWQK